MMTDALLQLSSEQAVTASAVSTNTIDLGLARDVGAGQRLFAAFTVDVTADSATDTATVTFRVIVSANANLSSADVLIASAAIPQSELTAGRKPICLPIPESFLNGNPVGKRYLGVDYVVAGENLTAGKFSCAITDTDVSVGKNYASGFTVA